jgi:hypothetical protein
MIGYKAPHSRNSNLHSYCHENLLTHTARHYTTSMEDIRTYKKNINSRVKMPLHFHLRCKHRQAPELSLSISTFISYCTSRWDQALILLTCINYPAWGVTLEGFMAISIKTMVFWNVTPCCLIHGYLHIGGKLAVLFCVYPWKVIVWKGLHTSDFGLTVMAPAYVHLVIFLFSAFYFVLFCTFLPLWFLCSITY